MKSLELLAPARNADIGIAAIDCGADAVYIAGPGFGARRAAGNSIEDVARLCAHAHKFGAKVFLTVNTIVYEEELQEVHTMMLEAQEAGIDAFIIQDPAISGFDDIRVPLHASTQCAIRTPERARELEKMGVERIILERELSMEQIRAIRAAVNCEIEVFVHGALCVCYSGKCNISEFISGRSANRGDCIQACRSLYDLEDKDGKVLVHNKALLSLKDLKLLGRLEELADCGVISFKIEGRLKNESYVKNIVREYSIALDKIVVKRPSEYRRASYGNVTGGFTPGSDKTFNRGYTELFIDGTRGKWSSMNAPKSMGEYIGTVKAVRDIDRLTSEITVNGAGKELRLSNGDGFAFLCGHEIIGFRGDVCRGNSIRCKKIEALGPGAELYRNISAAFEKELESNPCHREINAEISLTITDGFTIEAQALGADGKKASLSIDGGKDIAENRERMEAIFKNQLSKKAGIYSFSLRSINNLCSEGELPFVSAATLNGLRRDLASMLEEVQAAPVKASRNPNPPAPGKDWYELTHTPGIELMRSRYCIRYELGMCPVRQNARESGPLFLVNNGRKFALGFDCKNCEMTVKEAI